MNLSNEAHPDNLNPETSHAKAVTHATHATAVSAVENAVAHGGTVVATGSFKPYDTQLPIPALSGYRAVKCLYKASKVGGAAAAVNSYIQIEDSITAETVTANMTVLMPHIVSYLQSVEDEIVKTKHKAGTVFLSPEMLGLEVVVAKLEEKTVRLNKEAVEAWFTAEVESKLVDALVEKLGLESESESEGAAKLANVVEMYKQKYAALAGGKTMYRKQDAQTLHKALVVTGANKSVIGVRFSRRLEAMIEKKEVNSLADFGL
jgi:hypothetical protein